MFTGIVQAMGRVQAVKPNSFGVRLEIDRCGWSPLAPGSGAPGFTAGKRARRSRVGRGDSIAISGVCLTVVRATPKMITFDVIAETLDKTTLGGLKKGDPVNFEPPVSGNSFMGGHFVQGHVDGVGTITKVVSTKEEVRVTVKPPAELMDYIIPKGSVTLDGVSLTLASVGKADFDVALIPTTLDITTLGRAKKGGRVNLETDIVSKTIVSYLRRHEESGGGVTKETLQNAGFVGE